MLNLRICDAKRRTRSAEQCEINTVPCGAQYKLRIAIRIAALIIRVPSHTGTQKRVLTRSSLKLSDRPLMQMYACPQAFTRCCTGWKWNQNEARTAEQHIWYLHAK